VEEHARFYTHSVTVINTTSYTNPKEFKTFLTVIIIVFFLFLSVQESEKSRLWGNHDQFYGAKHVFFSNKHKIRFPIFKSIVCSIFICSGNHKEGTERGQGLLARAFRMVFRVISCFLFPSPNSQTVLLHIKTLPLRLDAKIIENPRCPLCTTITPDSNPTTLFATNIGKQANAPSSIN
jgi:hypothetical protein